MGDQDLTGTEEQALPSTFHVEESTPVRTTREEATRAWGVGDGAATRSDNGAQLASGWGLLWAHQWGGVCSSGARRAGTRGRSGGLPSLSPQDKDRKRRATPRQDRSRRGGLALPGTCPDSSRQVSCRDRGRRAQRSSPGSSLRNGATVGDVEGWVFLSLSLC